ncbi:MAG: methyltransferase domain-containing protein [Acidobacteria bacterium]|nr:methyltransferase domain-containing protein [Acidobacteriota bacterium]
MVSDPIYRPAQLGGVHSLGGTEGRAHCLQHRHLCFERKDATDLGFARRFDVVTSARTLQWIAEVADAISNMARAAKHDGLVVVLDYNHSLNEWAPNPPPQFLDFYQAFLRWRHSNGWDNAMGNSLPALFTTAGLIDIQISSQDEVCTRGDQGFSVKTALWSEVIDNVGSALQMSGFCDSVLLADARRAYEHWRERSLMKQVLSMTAVVGRVHLPS